MRTTPLHAHAALALLALLTAGCPGASSDSAPASEGSVQQACEEPRPEVCIQIYAPVCAQRDTGIRCVTTPCPSAEPREYPNGCEACRDPKVLSFAPGPCPQGAAD